MTESGNISIHAENILPIIKRWLYSEKEIFLRELVSNGIDAMTKMNKIALAEDIGFELADAKIVVAIDKEARTLTITDTGVGMTADEVRKYINQVAFSGVQDFVERYQGKDEDQQIIGHFGLGFYSSFMVASKVEIDSLSYQKDAKAVRWSCDGSTTFTLDASERSMVGTSIILHIDAESDEILESSKIHEILNKYCAFMKYPVELDNEVVNDTTPIWTRSPTELKDEDYRNFYHKAFPLAGDDPLFWIHLNVDFPFKLKGVLFFPKLRRESEVGSQGEVKLFCNQVYVADNCKELMPEFLTLLRGAIDCPDLPLNVSRSALQKDAQAQKISQHILKKVADRIVGMAKTEKEDFEKYWVDIHPIIKFGMIREPKFYEKVIEVAVFKTSKGEFLTFDQYLEKHKEATSNKIIYASEPAAQHTYTKMYEEHGIDVLIADSLIDRHFMPFVEMQGDRKYQFQRVDADVSQHLIDSTTQKSTIVDPKDNKTMEQKLEEIFKKYIGKENLKVRVEGLKSSHVPGILLVDENQRRMQEFSKMSGLGDMSIFGNAEESLIVNLNNPVIKNLISLDSSFNREEDVKMIVQHVYDLAMLQQGQMSGETMHNFIQRTTGILAKFSDQPTAGQ